jgi:hypothetical protein
LTALRYGAIGFSARVFADGADGQERQQGAADLVERRPE